MLQQHSDRTQRKRKFVYQIWLASLLLAFDGDEDASHPLHFHILNGFIKRFVITCYHSRLVCIGELVAI